MIDLNRIYHDEIPSFLRPYMLAGTMQRLKGIDMNCGMNYTSFPLFLKMDPYSRYSHSLGTALIVWHFTNDRKQCLAGLFHDIATPAFSHVVDFMNGDHVKQESTEDNTAHSISASDEIMDLLSADGILLDEVADYHRYSVADNCSPHLSADRLEYTCGDAIEYRFCSHEQIASMFADIHVLSDEEGNPELGFENTEKAVLFAETALKCGRVYSSKEDRYGMERLAELLKKAVQKNILKQSDLYHDEEYTAAILKDSSLGGEWKQFCSLSSVQESCRHEDGSICVNAKKRWINPLVRDRGRVFDISESFRIEAEEFLKESYEEEWLRGDTY